MFSVANLTQSLKYVNRDDILYQDARVAITKEDVAFAVDQIEHSLPIIVELLLYSSTKRVGTKGSGNKGHKGRPGSVGGSAPTIGGLDPLSPDFSTDEYNRLVDGYQNDDLKDMEEKDMIAIFKKQNEQGRGPIKDGLANEIAKETGTSYEQTNAILQTWADSSNDHNELSMRFQEAAAKTDESEEGTELSDWQEQQKAETEEFIPIAEKCEETFNKLGEAEKWKKQNPNDPYGTELVRKAEDEYNQAQSEWSNATYAGVEGDTPTDWRMFLDARGGPPIAEHELGRIALSMKARTEIWLENLGLDVNNGFIILYRGVSQEALGLEQQSPGMVTYIGNAIESWSLEIGTALQFGSLVIAAKVPLSDIFCSALTGVGCVPETEFVIFGRERDAVLVNVENMEPPSSHW